MVNSILKSTFARRNHKERAQPLNRQRLGNLEKHKDYVLRARDYKSKQDRIQKLREKAAFRNKDEFYWGMVKGKTKAGVAQADRGNEALSVDVVKLLKTQDVGYIRLQIAKDEKSVNNLRRELEITAPSAGPDEWSAAAELAEVEKLAEMGVVLQGPESAGISKSRKGKGKAPPSGHVVFAEDRSEFNATASSSTVLPPAESQEPDAQIDLGWLEDEPKPKKAGKSPVDSPDTEDDARAHRISLLTSLSAHLARLKLLRQAEHKLQDTKSLMGKGAARKVRSAGWVEDTNEPEDRNGERKRFEGKVWKWKLERKR